MTYVINFISGPCAGKSTIASAVFAELKFRQYSAEYIQEHAKWLIYKGLFEELNNQYNVSMEQYKMVKCVKGQVQYICVDSPLLLGLYYNRSYLTNVSNVSKTESMILEKNKEFKNIYIFLERHSFPYQNEGRVHTEEQAKQIDAELVLLLKELNIEYKTFKSDKKNVSKIIDYVLTSV
jgi:AAA domain